MNNFRDKKRGGRGFGGNRGGGVRGFGGNRGGGRSFGGDRGGRKFGGDRRGGDRPEMHKVVCSKCGVDCEVPFKPTTDKPLFCSKCFGDNQGDDSRGGNRFGDRKPRFGSDRGQASTRDYKKDFEMLNTKLDKILKALKVESEGEVRELTDIEGIRKVEKAKRKEIDKKSLKETLKNAIGKKDSSKKKTTKKSTKKTTNKAVKKSKKK